MSHYPVDLSGDEYSLTDGSRPFTGEVAGVTPTADASLATKEYVDTNAGTGGGASAEAIGAMTFLLMGA